MKKANKYKAKKVAYDGHVFDSQAEMVHYKTLKFREMTGAIRDLRMQVKYEIAIYGFHVCDYVADFVYFDVSQNRAVVVDVKSKFTSELPVYRLKKKLMRAVHRIEVVEVVF